MLFYFPAGGYSLKTELCTPHGAESMQFLSRASLRVEKTCCRVLKCECHYSIYQTRTAPPSRHCGFGKTGLTAGDLRIKQSNILAWSLSRVYSLERTPEGT